MAKRGCRCKYPQRVMSAKPQCGACGGSLPEPAAPPVDTAGGRGPAIDLSWEFTPRTENCAALSWTPEGPDHYVISHRDQIEPQRHTLSHRPFAGTSRGKHQHVGTFTTAEAAKAAALQHALDRKVT